MRHRASHRTEHIGWMRAAVLGANDGLLSTASLVVGVAASGTSRSALTFAVGALLPVVVAAIAPRALLTGLVTISALVLLAALGIVAARVGGASMRTGAMRVLFWGALAMGVSALVGRLFGTAIKRGWSAHACDVSSLADSRQPR